MRQFQIDKTNLANVQMTECDVPKLKDGEVLLKVERFGLSTNNITYAVAGDTLGYWQFFKPENAAFEKWGLMPVWGFAQIEQSGIAELPVGERIFGYFPPADYVVMKPEDVTGTHFFDASEHRAQLPKGYNLYRRVEAEPGYERAGDAVRMLLYPLYVTSFVIADQLAAHDWYSAENIVIVSASSKTSIGLAYALTNSGKGTIGLTSARNRAFVESLGIYDQVVEYEALEAELDKVPSVIVDMAGNADVLGRLHMHLSGQMKQTLSVGLTHWDAERRSSDVIKDRTEFFFAPARIQQRIKDWGVAGFNEKSAKFFADTVAKSNAWLNLQTLDGLDGLASVYDDVLMGKINPRDGFLIAM